MPCTRSHQLSLAIGSTQTSKPSMQGTRGLTRAPQCLRLAGRRNHKLHNEAAHLSNGCKLEPQTADTRRTTLGPNPAGSNTAHKCSEAHEHARAAVLAVASKPFLSRGKGPAKVPELLRTGSFQECHSIPPLCKRLAITLRNLRLFSLTLLHLLPHRFHVPGWHRLPRRRFLRRPLL